MQDQKCHRAPQQERSVALHAGCSGISGPEREKPEFLPEEKPCQHHLLQGGLPSICSFAHNQERKNNKKEVVLSHLLTKMPFGNFNFYSMDWERIAQRNSQTRQGVGWGWNPKLIPQFDQLIKDFTRLSTRTVLRSSAAQSW